MNFLETLDKLDKLNEKLVPHSLEIEKGARLTEEQVDKIWERIKLDPKCNYLFERGFNIKNEQLVRICKPDIETDTDDFYIDCDCEVAIDGNFDDYKYKYETLYDYDIKLLEYPSNEISRQIQTAIQFPIDLGEYELVGIECTDYDRVNIDYIIDSETVEKDSVASYSTGIGHYEFWGEPGYDREEDVIIDIASIIVITNVSMAFSVRKKSASVSIEKLDNMI